MSRPLAPITKFWHDRANLPFEPRPPLASPRDTLTRKFSQVERATVRVVAPATTEVPLENGMLAEAAFRLSLLQDRGILQHASGHWVAATLSHLFWGEHPSKRADRGWELLRVLDVQNYVRVTLSAEPNADDPWHFRTMRMHRRVTELTAEQPFVRK